MECPGCRHSLAALHQIMFYCKGEKDVFLTIKPEFAQIVEEKSLKVGDKVGKKIKVSCKHCEWELGGQIPFGPNGTNLIGFGSEKVKVLGHHLSKKDKWWSEKDRDRFSSLTKRGTSDFFKDRESEEKETPQFQPPTKRQTKFASNDEDFDWRNLLENKVPRDYQVLSFVEALHQDLVAVLPTGAGKTLIASMWLKRMRELNPEKMGLFVVDRIPLVVQQKKAIQKDTGLRVLDLFGESKTLKKVKDLHKDHYDVLVATAGSVVHMLNSGHLFLSMFSSIVLDEAHHVLGNHMYSKLLKIIQLEPKMDRPRLLGLTASPFGVDTLTKGKQKLAELEDIFQTTAIFKPEAPKLEQEAPETWRVTPTEHQLKFSRDVIEAYKRGVDGVMDCLSRNLQDLESKLTRPKDKDTLTSSEIGALKGEINTLELSLEANTPGLKQMLQELSSLLEALDVADTISIDSAIDLLKENKTDLPSQANYVHMSSSESSSSRLQILRKLLIKKGTEAQCKILVFVKSRITARRLKDVLKEEFPDLAPELMVGHGGFDGQKWEDDQENIIANFHEGKCKLLVCTSVLEEGIDVSSCDLVVRYSGVNTLIQFIQSRGRARKEGSRFAVLVTREEENKSMAIEEEERLMELLLSGHNKTANLPSDKTTSVIRRIESDDMEELTNEPKLKKAKFAHLTNHSIIEFYVPDNDGLTKKEVSDALIETMESAALKVGRLDVFPNEARKQSSCPLMFEKQDHVVLCQASNSSGDESISRYHSIAVGWNYKLAETSSTTHPTLSKLICKGIRNPKLEWMLSDVAVGSLTSQKTFDQFFNFSETDKSLTLSQTGHLLKLSIDNWRIELSLLSTSVQGFGLASWEKKSCVLFIPLGNIPNMFERVGEEETDRIRVLDHPFLRTLARHPVVKIKINIDDNEDNHDWWILRQIFATPDLIPFPVFDTRIGQCNRDNEEEHDVSIEGSMLYKFNQMSFLKKRSMLHAEWSILQKNTDLQMAVSDEMASEHIQKVRDAFFNNNGLEGLKIAMSWSMSTRKNYSMWTPFIFIQHQEYLNIKDLPGSTFDRLSDPIPANHTQLLRLVITPTRHIFMPSVPINTSRLTRMLGSSHSTVVVSFREENMQKLHETGVYPKIQEVLNSGFNAAGRSFHFLCASASQIRDHKAFFVEVNCPSEVYSLRKLIIEEPEVFKVPAQFLSRLGLFCTADQPTIDIQQSELGEIEDEYAKDGTLVTDGSGFIKLSTTKRAFKEIGEDSIPSAFQFRLGGMKGVLTVVDDSFVEKQAPGRSILYRPSQKKFKSDHKKLGIVKSAKAHPLKLNREAITLLESWYLTAKEKEMWHLPNALINLQEKYLESQADMFENTSETKETLLQYLPAKDVEENAEVFELKAEPFWFRLLRYCHVFGVSTLCKKTNIPVKDGCLIMGIPDFTGSLRKDEVFIQVSMEEEEPRSIIGPVLMYRNPCLHPGDIRLVIAVDKPELQGQVNVLVLPTKNQETSLSGMCSGGDLDGDQFSVIWDKTLVPVNRNLQHASLNYGSLDGSLPTDEEGAWHQERLAGFYVDCMKNELLGRVAHMHLAHSDMAELGAADAASMKLAESQAVAVDYPKTGVAPKVPEEAMKKVRDTGCPDFMEKKRGESYPSTKVLGKLYQSSRSYLFEYEITEEDYRKIPLDQALVSVEGSDEFLSKAEIIYKEYVVDMKLLMHMFSLNSEEEVVLGKAVRLHSLLDCDREKVYNSLKENYKALKKKYRDKILYDLTKSEYEPMVAACYKVAYDQNREKNKRKGRNNLVRSRPFLSFPWTVSEYLREIKRKTHFQPPKIRESLIHREIGNTVKSLLDKDLPGLKSTTKAREQVFITVKDAIEKKNKDMLEVFPYGSSSVFLSEECSDMDICVETKESAFGEDSVGAQLRRLPESRKQAHFLINNISPAIDEVMDKKVDLTTLDNPIIKGEVGSLQLDVSCNMEGSRKTQVLLGIFNQCPEMFVIFRTIIKWCRQASLVKDDDFSKDCAVFPTAEMYAIILDLLVDKQMPREAFTSAETKNMTRNLDKISKNVKDFAFVGEKMDEFFRFGQALPEQDLTISWRVHGVKDVTILAYNISRLKKACSQALHCLRVTRNIEKVLVHASDCTDTQTNIVKKLPLTLSHSIGSALEFHARHWAFRSGAKVELVPGEPGEDRIILKAEGSRTSLAELRTLLADLTRTKRSLVIGVPTKQASRYFLVGSTLMLMMKNDGLSCRLAFTDSEGSFQLSHQANQRSTPVLSTDDTVDEETWLVNRAIPSLTETMKTQLAAFPLENQNYVANVEVTTRFGTFYTVNIEESLPKTQKTLSLEEFQEICEKGRSMRKALERGKFDKVRTPNKNQRFKMVPLKTGRGHADIADNKTSKLRRLKKGKKGIAMSYQTGALNPFAPEENRRRQIDEAKKVYKAVLDNLGFESGFGWAEDFSSETGFPQLPGHCFQEHWKVTVNASTGYEITLNLDANMGFKSMTERNLSWVHTTIFHGKEMTPTKNLLVPENDIRFLVQTAEQVKPETKLFKFVFPEGDTDAVPVRIEGVRKAPKFSAGTSQELRSAIPLAKHAATVQAFTRDGVTASIITGTTWMGENLSEKRDYCDLSLYFNNKQLVEAIREPEQMEELVESCLRISVRVSRELNKLIKAQNRM